MRRDHVFVTVLLAALVGSVQPSPGQTAGSKPRLPTGPAPDLNLVFSSQVKGWIEPCG